MANKAVFHSVHDLFRHLHQTQAIFGGKIVILLSDFRQTCPVIPHGSPAEVIDTSIKSSLLWPAFHIYHLTIPVHNAEDPKFAQFVNAIGNGAGPNVTLNLILHVSNADDLIHFSFPPEIINNANACLHWSILAPTNQQIDSYNATIIDHIHTSELPQVS